MYLQQASYHALGSHIFQFPRFSVVVSVLLSTCPLLITFIPSVKYNWNWSTGLSLKALKFLQVSWKLASGWRERSYHHLSKRMKHRQNFSLSILPCSQHTHILSSYSRCCLCQVLVLDSLRKHGRNSAYLSQGISNHLLPLNFTEYCGADSQRFRCKVLIMSWQKDSLLCANQKTQSPRFSSAQITSTPLTQPSKELRIQLGPIWAAPCLNLLRAMCLLPFADAKNCRSFFLLSLVFVLCIVSSTYQKNTPAFLLHFKLGNHYKPH